MKPGDIIFTYKGSIFSKLIRWISNRKDNDVSMTHCAMVIDSKTFIESDIKVWLCPVGELQDNEYYEIWECPKITDSERDFLVAKANSYFGRYYSVPKLIYHALDAYLGKIFSTDVFLFRRLSTSDKYVICSWIVACSYSKIGFKFSNPDFAATPDDIYDFVKKYRWNLVEKKI